MSKHREFGKRDRRSRSDTRKYRDGNDGGHRVTSTKGRQNGKRNWVGEYLEGDVRR